MYDDYVELQPGAVGRLDTLIKDYFRDEPTSMKSVDAGDSSSSTTAGFKKTVAGLRTWCKEVFASGRSWSLPGSKPPRKSVETLGLCPVISQTPQTEHNFVLLCVPFMQRAVKLHQAEVCRINSDQEFFRLLRYYYASQRGVRSWARLRRVDYIKFVKVSRAC